MGSKVFMIYVLARRHCFEKPVVCGPLPARPRPEVRSFHSTFSAINKAKYFYLFYIASEVIRWLEHSAISLVSEEIKDWFGFFSCAL